MSSWPAEFEYLQPIAMRVGKYNEWHEVCDFISSLSPEERAEVSACFEELSARQDWEELLNWMGSPGGSLRDGSLKFHILRLFILFDVMGLLKSLPDEPSFISSSDPTSKFDWTSLPKDLSYLIGPAQRYGRVVTFEAQTELLRWHPSEEKAKLLQVAVRIRENNHATALEHWLRVYDPQLFPESIPIRNFYELLKRIVAEQPE